MFTYYLTENMHVESLQFTAEAPSQDNLHLPLQRQGRALPVLKLVVSVTTPYLFMSEVHAEGTETVPLPWRQFLSLLPGKVLMPQAGSPQRWTWTSYLWARTTFLETLVIRTETLLGHCIQEASQCGQKISKTICFWQCALLHRWTVTFCSIWNIFSMHDFLS